MKYKNGNNMDIGKAENGKHKKDVRKTCKIKKWEDKI